MLFVITLVSMAPLFSVILSKISGNDKVKYTSLVVAIPLIIELYAWSSCRVLSLLNWYWLNCGIPVWERVIAALTMPTALISLTSLTMVIIGLKARNDFLIVLSTPLLLSLAFHWSNYLGLNGSMLGSPPRLPPLGYATLRSFPFFLYLPLLHVSLAFSISYLLTRHHEYAKAAAVTSFLSLSLAFAWGLWGFGVPLPLTAYHVSLLLYAVSTAFAYLVPSLASDLALVISSISVFVLPRLYPVGYGGMPTPFFGIQTSISIALLFAIATSWVYGFKRHAPRFKGGWKELVLFLTSLQLLVISLFDVISTLASTSKSVPRPPLEIEFLGVSLSIVIASLLLIASLIKDRKCKLVSLLGFLHPYLSLILSVGISSWIAMKRNKRETLLAFSALLLAYSLIYGSALAYLTPYSLKLNNVTKVRDVTSKIYRYGGNATAYELVKEYKFSNVTLRGRMYVPIYMNKYIPPNAENFFQWAVPQFNFLETCALRIRPMLKFEFRASCVPLGAVALIAPALLAFALVSYRELRGGSTTS